MGKKSGWVPATITRVHHDGRFDVAWRDPRGNRQEGNRVRARKVRSPEKNTDDEANTQQGVGPTPWAEEDSDDDLFYDSGDENDENVQD